MLHFELQAGYDLMFDVPTPSFSEGKILGSNEVTNASMMLLYHKRCTLLPRGVLNLKVG